MTDALRAEILDMLEEARVTFTSRLRCMSSFELQHENNNTQNCKVAQGMGLEGVTAFFRMKKRVQCSGKLGNAKKRRKTDDGVEEDSPSSDRDDSEGDEDSRDESEGDASRTPVKTRGSTRVSKAAVRRQDTQMGRVSESHSAG
jgi:hypothetical protein